MSYFFTKKNNEKISRQDDDLLLSIIVDCIFEHFRGKELSRDDCSLGCQKKIHDLDFKLNALEHFDSRFVVEVEYPLILNSFIYRKFLREYFCKIVQLD